MKTKLWISVFLVITGASLFVNCGEAEPSPTVPTQPSSTGITLQESQQIALEFVQNCATFQYDGIADTLKHADTMTLRCPSCWAFVYRFDSRHSGYGDRAGQILAQVITHHEATITVIQGEITEARMDGKWDMLFQMMVATEEESLRIAEDFLRNSPTYKYDGVEGSIKHIETLEAFCPYCWGFVFEFQCLNTGYGDRSNKQVSSIITRHKAHISVSQGKVDGGTIDDKWDMMTQQEITPPTIETAEHN